MKSKGVQRNQIDGRKKERGITASEKDFAFKCIN